MPCSFCKENQLTCNYRDTPPAKYLTQTHSELCYEQQLTHDRTDKNMEKLMAYMEEQLANQRSMMTDIQRVDQRVSNIERRSSERLSVTDEKPAIDTKPTIEGKPATKEVSGPGNVTAVTDAIEAPVKSVVADHRTAPHKLLFLWPSVRALLSAADAQHDLIATYVMEAESRGTLRLHTRGEGVDNYDGTHPGVTISPSASEDISAEELNGAAPSPPEGVWGTPGPQTPQNDIRQVESHCWGGLKPDGSLDLDEDTIESLFQSYMENIHLMHPFLDRQRLRTVFDNFIKRYATEQHKIRTSSAAFAVGFNSADGERAAKRQRSNGSTAVHISNPEPVNIQPPYMPERSPRNALVFLVLALGKICLYKDPLPGPVPDNNLNVSSAVSHQMNGALGLSPLSANMKRSPRSPMSASTTQRTMPGNDYDGKYSNLRNVDVIPGLAYFAKAVEIIGEQTDGSDLVHAQMFLLAGLYKGQLARVKESMSFFHMAGRALLQLLEQRNLYTEIVDVETGFKKAQKKIKDQRDNLILLAAWTCVQLESDILAELRLPSSGLPDNEHLLLLPREVPQVEVYNEPKANDGDDSFNFIMVFYSAQTFLRKRLNAVHRELYGAAYVDQKPSSVRDMLRGHNSVVAGWRDSLPVALQWDNSDTPATDILNARMRAKYWGACYVINRPFLDYVLHISPYVREGKSVKDSALDVDGKPRDPADVHLFEAIQGMHESEIWQGCRRCIEAAMQSTVALDGVPDRLIVTNIHGTAHA